MALVVFVLAAWGSRALGDFLGMGVIWVLPLILVLNAVIAVMNVMGIVGSVLAVTRCRAYRLGVSLFVVSVVPIASMLLLLAGGK